MMKLEDTSEPAERLDTRSKVAIREVAERILQGEVHFIQGCREITSIAGYLVLREDLLVPIGLVESETEGVPVGPTETLWNPDSREAKMAEVQGALGGWRRQVFDASTEIIERYPAQT